LVNLRITLEYRFDRNPNYTVQEVTSP
jgi:hypothetical protein